MVETYETDTLHELPGELEEAYQLGIPTAEYQTGWTFRLKLIVGVLLVLLGGALCFVEVWFGSLALIGSGAWLAIRMFRNRNLRVLVFPEGFVHIQGGKVTVFRWDHIEAVWEKIVQHNVHGIPVGTSHSYTVRRDDGQKVSLGNDLRKVMHLGQLILQETHKRQLPRAIGTVTAGGTMSFGKFSVNRRGISQGKKNLPWGEIKSVSWGNGHITIKKQGKWFSWARPSVSSIPNHWVFVSLVQYLQYNPPK